MTAFRLIVFADIVINRLQGHKKKPIHHIAGAKGAEHGCPHHIINDIAHVIHLTKQ